MSYDPTIGRWTSEDPISFEGGDADLSRYVGNSPTNFIDPAGLDKTPADLVDGLQGLINDLLTPRPTITIPPGSIPPGVRGGINAPISFLGQNPTEKTRPQIMGNIPMLTLGNGVTPGKGRGGAVAPPSASTNITLLPSANPPPIGVTGATPCAGLILIPKDPKDRSRPYKAYHFGGLDDPTDTLRGTNPYAIPAWGDSGYIALIMGAIEDSPDSLTSLLNLTQALRNQNIPIKSYIRSISVIVDPNTGDIYDTTPPGMAR
jgi:hypothetical protein